MVSSEVEREHGTGSDRELCAIIRIDELPPQTQTHHGEEEQTFVDFDHLSLHLHATQWGKHRHVLHGNYHQKGESDDTGTGHYCDHRQWNRYRILQKI